MVDIVQNKENYQENKKGKNIKYDIIIVGAGGFGREVYFWAKDSFSKDQYRIKGFLDDNPRILDNYDMEVGIIGNLNSYEVKRQDRFVFAIAKTETKVRLITKLKKRGAKFISLIHPSVLIVPTAKIGEGVVICPNCIITTNVQIDNYVTINSGTIIGHDIIIQDYTSVMSQVEIGGNSKLGSKVFIGSCSMIIPGRKIGDNAFVGAGSVVIRNVEENTNVFGNPAKRIKR